ncbi:MAG: hypothetical protein LKJ86_06495 [Oscillibacter sp.]|jgi:hypothetical protein|nr:hypothetical protein [Oscillibacter sp.]
MLDRKSLLAELAAQPLDFSRCWLTAGGALVLWGLRQATHDIDLGCETSLADELEHAGFPEAQKPDGSRKFHLPPNTDVFENWGRGTVDVIDGIPVVSLADLLALKRQLNREKDQADIAALEKALGKNRT